jgi:hypothetical protein
MYCTLEKIDQWQQRTAKTEILMWLLEHSLELVSVFKEASRIFYYFYSFTRRQNISKNHLLMYV